MEKISVGVRGHLHNGAGSSFFATVTNVNDDGTVDVQAEDGGQLHFIQLSDKETDTVCFVPGD